MKLYEELRARGLVAQISNEIEVPELIDNGKATFYVGFDPTADSLTAGHFMVMSLMRRLQLAGNKPIVLIGGGTTMVGDPSGRQDLRSMMTTETIDRNGECFLRQMSRFLDFSEGKATMVNNARWLRELNYLDFMRDVGRHFTVNRMLTAECYKSRMEKGLTFLEFNYMIMQAYDFYELFRRFGCNMQLGGDDQWSNMLAGTELIRRKLGKDSHVMTMTLLLNSDGEKMGKTAKGALWLDPNKTAPFEFFQYWRNVTDADVLSLLKKLTFLPLEQITEMEALKGEELNRAKETLAYEMTSIVHGKEEADRSLETARDLFKSGGAAEMPFTKLVESDFTDGSIDILTILHKSGLCASKAEARRAVEQGGVEAGGEKVTQFSLSYKMEDLDGDGLIVRRGKKSFRRITLDE